MVSTKRNKIQYFYGTGPNWKMNGKRRAIYYELYLLDITVCDRYLDEVGNKIYQSLLKYKGADERYKNYLNE